MHQVSNRWLRQELDALADRHAQLIRACGEDRNTRREHDEEDEAEIARAFVLIGRVRERLDDAGSPS